MAEKIDLEIVARCGKCGKEFAVGDRFGCEGVDGLDAFCPNAQTIKELKEICAEAISNKRISAYSTKYTCADKTVELKVTIKK